MNGQEASSAAKTGKPLAKLLIPIIVAVLAVAAAIVGIVYAVKLKNKEKTPDVVIDAGAYTSPTALARSEDGKHLYIADATGCAVYKVELETKKVVGTYNSAVKVNDVELSGDKVLVAEGELGGRLVLLSQDMKEDKALITGHTPSDILVKDGKAYVANRFSDTISCVDIASMSESANIKVGREPIALAASGSDIYVGCHIPEESAQADFISSDIYVIDGSANTVSKKMEICNGAGSLLGMCASPDGSEIYVTHIVARYQLPTTQLDGGWVNTNAVSVVDTAKKEVGYSFLLDNVDYGAANPWGVAVSEDGKTLYVALSGTNQICRVNLTKLATLLKTFKKNYDISRAVDQINLAQDAKDRLTLDAAGLRSLLLSNGSLYVTEYFSGGVGVISEESFTLTDTISVKQQPEADEIRLGELYWYDATSCYQMWQSCNSCHPDVRADGFNWDNLNDGIGNAKQAKSILYSHRTPPVMVTGIRANAEVADIAGMRFIQYNADFSKQVPYIDAFLKSLLPTQSPYLNNDGTLTASAQHGKELFVEYGCATCHPAPLFTDLKMHESPDIELTDDWENRPLDTPTLVEVWRTAPYTFCGHYEKMSDYMKFLVQKAGKTISDSDAEDLANYVLSIGIEGEQYGVVQLKNDDSTYNKLTPGKTLTSVSVVKQAPGAPDGKLTVTVYDASGKTIDSAEVELKDMKYGRAVEMTFEKAVSTEGAASVVVSIKDQSGAAIATDLKFD